MTNKKAQEIARDLIGWTATPETIKQEINSNFKGFTGYEIHFMLGQATVEFKNGYHFGFGLTSNKDETIVKITQAVALDPNDKIICNITN